MKEKLYLLISEKEISTNQINMVRNEEIGAIVSFIGTVRNVNNEKKVKYILYEIFEDLVNNLIFKKCKSYFKKNSSLKMCIIQRKGILKINDINLIISVGAKHRKEAFMFCKNMLEFIKKNTPIWKKEYYMDETSKWINS